MLYAKFLLMVFTISIWILVLCYQTPVAAVADPPHCKPLLGSGYFSSQATSNFSFPVSIPPGIPGSTSTGWTAGDPFSPPVSAPAKSVKRTWTQASIPYPGAVPSGGPVKYYFTHYGLGDRKQTDSTPCISADGQDSCEKKRKGIATMALTSDIRATLGIKFGDSVRLTGDPGCDGTYVVTDEMACRFRGRHAWSYGPCKFSDGTLTPRVSHVKRPRTPYYIKGDLPGRPGGACFISKL